MQYIGNKQSLVNNIYEIMQKNGVSGETIIDVFAGTQSVGIFFKKQGFRVISNDWQKYSYTLGKAYIENSEFLKFEKICTYLNIESSYESILNYLDNIEPVEGFIYENFCPTGSSDKEYQRMYFLDENGKKFDAIRQKLESWKNDNLINENEYYVLLATLVEAVDKVSNTTSVYGAFLKTFKDASAKIFMLKPLDLISSLKENLTYCMPAEEFVKQVKGEIFYLDPPYNARQYASNYHVLETMVLYDNPILYGKTGTREYTEQKSEFCSKVKVLTAFERLIKEIVKSDAKYIVMSYNNEGLLKEEEIINAMKNYGDVIKEEIDYKRFRADKDSENRRYKTDRVKELVFILKINK